MIEIEVWTDLADDIGCSAVVLGMEHHEQKRWSGRQGGSETLQLRMQDFLGGGVKPSEEDIYFEYRAAGCRAYPQGWSAAWAKTDFSLRRSKIPLDRTSSQGEPSD